MKLKALLVTLAVFTTVPLVLTASEGKTVEVTGEILDLACYISQGAHGEDHAGCAKRCVKGGQPMGVMAADGTVYVLFADHSDASAFDQAKEHAGEKVTVKGTLSDRAGMKGITVSAVSAP